MEQAWTHVQALLATVLGIDVPVDSLEQMNQHMARAVEDFRQEQPVPKPAEEGEIFVMGGDGKGVPMRRSEHESKPGPHLTSNRTVKTILEPRGSIGGFLSETSTWRGSSGM